MDEQSCGASVHDINTLTVIASESYKSFVADLQSDIKSVLYDRPITASAEYFVESMLKLTKHLQLLTKKLQKLLSSIS